MLDGVIRSALFRLVFLALAASVFLCAAARAETPTRGSRVFSIVGLGAAAGPSPSPGALATEVALRDGLKAMAVTPEGDVVLLAPENKIIRFDSQGRVYSVLKLPSGYAGDGGPATQARAGRLVDIAVTSDRSLYLADERTCNIRRISPEGVITTVAGQHTEAYPAVCADSTGTDGLARETHFCGPDRIGAMPSGELLVKSGCGRIYVIGSDGSIRLLAGGVRGGRLEEGQTALSAPFNGTARPTPLPDGTIAIAHDGQLWHVGRDQRLRLIARVPSLHAVAVLGLDDGSLLVATGNVRHYLALRRPPDWAAEELLGAAARSPLASAHDGDAGPLARADLVATDLELAPDGGVLVMGWYGVRYLPPSRPQRLAIGLARATLSSRLPLRVTVETTLPASVIFTVRVGGRLQGRRTITLPAGRSAVRIPGGRARGLNSCAPAPALSSPATTKLRQTASACCRADGSRCRSPVGSWPASTASSRS